MSTTEMTTDERRELLAELRADLEEARQLAQEALDAEAAARARVDQATTRRAFVDSHESRSEYAKAKNELARAQETRALADAKVRGLERGVEQGQREERSATQDHWRRLATEERDLIAADSERTEKMLDQILEALETEQARLADRAREVERGRVGAAAAGVGWPAAARLLDRDYQVWRSVRQGIDYMAQLRRH